MILRALVWIDANLQEYSNSTAFLAHSGFLMPLLILCPKHVQYLITSKATDIVIRPKSNLA
jgi:hypothetical protein